MMAVVEKTLLGLVCVAQPILKLAGELSGPALKRAPKVIAVSKVQLLGDG
ncbi:hypothetical protein swp_0093 [Shewanella piezotolerans WP3]|uniref:Uncharacterized protein n=1 Tax=Shewanella piezotolerans (strain WP3 / JCM 13877) TaxID=225849 RepID=B8CGU5_SHEPW|nr:hypothetical protein swp_0093 [Shewanella piezotolerans WP3]